MSQIPRKHRAGMNIPRSVLGYGADEFIFFQWNPILDNSKFRVLLEDLSGSWVNIGTLNSQVYIPDTHFPQDAKLVIVGTNRHGEQVRFIGTLIRSAHYTLAGHNRGDHLMESYVKKIN